jgi:hypothetical protein
LAAQYGRYGYRRIAAGIGFGLVEVGMAVEEEEPVTTPTPECEKIAEQDRTVSLLERAESAVAL